MHLQSLIVHLLFLLLITINSNYLLAQKNVTVPVQKYIIAGEITSTSEPIKAIQYEFSDSIRLFHIDSLSGLIAIQLRSKSKPYNSTLRYTEKILLFDPELKQVKWENNIVFPIEKYYHLNHSLLRLSGNKSYLVDISTGESIWSLKNIIYHVNPENNMGIGYRFNNKSGISNILEGINLQTGEEIWEREINRKYGWGNIKYLNDSTILVADEGLHKIGLKNGLGWDYKTGEVTISQNLPAIYKEVIIKRSIVTGSFIVNYQQRNFSEIGTNLLVDGDHLYFASSNEISNLTADGDVLWENLLSEKKLTGNTRIFLKGDNLYIVNLGFYSKIKDAEKPYFAAYNKNTGSRVFKLEISNSNGKAVSFIKLAENSIFVFLKDKIVEYSLNNGKKLQESIFDTTLFGEIKGQVNNKALVRDGNSHFNFLDIYDPQKHYLYTNKEIIICLDGSLKVFENIPAKYIWILHSENDTFKIIVNGKNAHILDSDNKILARLNVSMTLELSGSKLYDIQGKNLIEFDLKNFFDVKQ